MQGRLVNLRPIEKADLTALNRWKNNETLYMFWVEDISLFHRINKKNG